MRIDCCVSYFQKQLIGLLPNESECFFYYSPNLDVTDWFIDGISIYDPITINATLNPYGYLYNIFFLSDGTYRFILSYIGTSAPTYIPAITDDIGDPVTYTLTNCCNKICLEGAFNAADAVYLQTSYGWNWYNGAAIFGHPSVEEAIKSLYGTQTIYTATDNGDGTWYVKIDNAYVCNPPLAWSGDDVTYTDMVPCGTPVCLYTTFTYNDSTGNNCFTSPGYNFNGQGIDFTAAANVYGGYAIQYGNSGTLPYGGDTCSIVTFSYIGYSQPADIIVDDPTYGVINLPLSAQFCEKGCLTTNSILLKDTYDGINLCDYIYLPFSSFGTVSLDFVNDLAGAEAYINLILSKFCPGAIVNITADGADYFTLTFNNLYYSVINLNFQLFDNSGIPSISTTLVPC